MVPGFVVTGIGSGLATPTLGAAAGGSVPLERAGMAAGVLNTMRQLGLTFGIAVLGGVFASRATHVLAGRGVGDPAGVGREVSGGQARQLLGVLPEPARSALSAGIRAAAVDGVQATFLVCGVAGLLAGVLVLALHRPRPAVPGALPDLTEEPSAA